MCGLLAAAWWVSPTATDLEQIAAWLSARRHAWYALPAVMIPLSLALLINHAFRRLRPAE